VIYGKPVADALADALSGSSRVLLVTNSSLAGAGGLAATVRQLLGERCVDVISGVHAHSPRQDVVRIAMRLRETGADAAVGLGGGSVCDAAKVARWCVGNDVFEAADMDRLRDGVGLAPPQRAFVMIPTTLSAGEFTPIAGVTDERGPRKEVYRHPLLPPEVVVLDPSMTQATPPRLWFGTGMRAVDHAVETWCSIKPTPHADATALHALRLLAPGLRRCIEAPDDREARLQCQIGAWLSIQGAASGVYLGASHGIGHALGGTAGMAHGETSCVMLPHVLRYNARVNGQRQAVLSEAMGRPGAALGDVVADLVTALGMPGRLRDAGVSREVLPKVAEEALHDHWVKANPREIKGTADILALLEQAW
jgi:alcohol dehydrogenase class IV